MCKMQSKKLPNGWAELRPGCWVNGSIRVYQGTPNLWLDQRSLCGKINEFDEEPVEMMEKINEMLKERTNASL